MAMNNQARSSPDEAPSRQTGEGATTARVDERATKMATSLALGNDDDDD